jgi:hypothetical protein
MSIHIHIGSISVDHAGATACESGVVHRAVERQLADRVKKLDIKPELRRAAEASTLKTELPKTERPVGPCQLGAQIAHSIYGGLQS